MEYTINHFIDKFSKIPNRMWTTGSDGWLGIEGKFCADGFCGSIGGQQTEEGKALAKLLLPLTKNIQLSDVVWYINDGSILTPYSKGHYLEPKERILAALYDVQIQEENIKSAKEIIRKKEFVERVNLLISVAPDDTDVCDYEEDYEEIYGK